MANDEKEMIAPRFAAPATAFRRRLLSLLGLSDVVSGL